MTHSTLSRAASPAEPTIAEAARRMAGASRPTPLGAWREIARTGALPGDPDPDSTAAGLVRRWHQHLAVAIDLPMERREPGEERLRELVVAWLDLARRTEPVRGHIARTSGPRSAAEAARQRLLLAGLLAEDLAAVGAADPERSAAELLDGLAGLAAEEDVAGRPLGAARAHLLARAGAASPAAPAHGWLDRLVGRLRPARAA